VAAYRISMQAICHSDQSAAIAEYLQVIPGFYSIAQPQRLDVERAYIDFSVVVREEVQEDTLLNTAEERVGQYLWQRPDLQPVDVKALAQERLSEDEELHLPPDYIPPQRAL
jgi:hypothetical protein